MPLVSDYALVSAGGAGGYSAHCIDTVQQVIAQHVANFQQHDTLQAQVIPPTSDNSV